MRETTDLVVLFAALVGAVVATVITGRNIVHARVNMDVAGWLQLLGALAVVAYALLRFGWVS